MKMQMMNKVFIMQSKSQNGFTLVELVIVIAVVGILSAIAFPSYQNFIREGRRADAQNMLLQVASLQEQFYSENGFYGRLEDILTDVDSGEAASDGGYYNITASCAPDSDDCQANARPQFYTLTARGLDIQEDDECGNLTYNQSGVREIVDADAGIEADDCW